MFAILLSRLKTGKTDLLKITKTHLHSQFMNKGSSELVCVADIVVIFIITQIPIVLGCIKSAICKLNVVSGSQ